MNLAALKSFVMFQTSNDPEDVGDFMPYLLQYINNGYDQVVNAYDAQHVPSEDYPALRLDSDEPLLPEWMHTMIADWATYMVYQNGNPQKQSRGYQFRTQAEGVLAKVRAEGGIDGAVTAFSNIPT